jgi:hypothetical protein
MENRAHLSEAGRKAGDPSIDLCKLMYDLRRTAPENRVLVCIPPALYAEAAELLNRQGHAQRQSTLHAASGALHTLFCGHWISPERPDLPDAAGTH